MTFREQIAELLFQVPRAPEETIPPGVTADEVAQFEERTGIKLPTVLGSWLNMTNGPCVGPGGFYGIHPFRSCLDIEELWTRHPIWKKSRWIPVAGDGCGNHYIMPTQNEFGCGYPVVFVDVGVSVNLLSYIVASNLEHFIAGILRKELDHTGWPFTRDETIAFDPRISEFHSIKYPWTA